MDKLVNLCINALSEVYHDVFVKKVNTKRFVVRQALFRKLVAVWYGMSSMIYLLGYSEHDVQKALDEYREQVVQGVVNAVLPAKNGDDL